MCGRITLLTYDELEAVLEAVETRHALRIEQDAARAQAKPGSELPAIASVNSELTLTPLIWGFRFPESTKLIFNTRIESALGGTRMWARPIREGRCIVPAASFFEPHESEKSTNSRTGRPVKRQYEFSSPIEEPLLLAGVQQEGRLSIVTTTPNASVSPIHPRMPLVLRFEEVRTWLGDDFPALADRSNFELLSRPEDDEANPPQLSLF